MINGNISARRIETPVIIELMLPLKTAQLLRTVLNNINGDWTGPKKQIDDIIGMLASIGVGLDKDTTANGLIYISHA